MTYTNRTTMDNRMAVLLARGECRDNPAAVACCDAFLKMFHVIKEPSFIELTCKESER